MDVPVSNHLTTLSDNLIMWLGVKPPLTPSLHAVCNQSPSLASPHVAWVIIVLSSVRYCMQSYHIERNVYTEVGILLHQQSCCSVHVML